MTYEKILPKLLHWNRRICDIPMVCEKYGTKAVIIGGTHALAAAADLIKEAVADSNIMITGVFEYGGEASREHIDELNSHQEVIDADMIFACGGGKAIDTCKVLSQESNRPFFTFPTIASTCASCTSLGIIYHHDVHFVNILSRRNLLNGSLSIHK